MKLRGVFFTRNVDGISDTGVIAQEILKVLPESQFVAVDMKSWQIE
jgi:hypothetical protein